MILIILNIIIKRLRLRRNWLISLFLILIAMLTSYQVFPQIETEFTTSTNNIGCGPLFVEFQDLSSGNPDAWLWDFGNGDISNQQNPTYIYQLPGVYSVTLISSNNNNIDTVIKTNFIKVLDYPRSDFEIEYNCTNPLAVNLINNSIGYDSLLWEFGNGSTSNITNPQYLFNSRGTYLVKLSAINQATGCIDEYIDLAEVRIPIASFDYLINSNNSYEDSVGCVPHKVYLNNLSQDYSYYKVEWSDGYTGHGRIDHEFTIEGVFNVSMIVTDIHGCKDTMQYENMFKVHDIQADFDILNQVNCNTIDFVNLSSGTNILWDFGDNNTSLDINPQHIYTENGTYNVALYVESEERCRDTLIKNNLISVNIPNSEFITTNLFYCPNDSIEFINNSIGQGLSYNWDFSDLSISNEINPIYSFNSNGNYNIRLTILDSLGCTDSFSQNISIVKPTADFLSSSVSPPCPPLTSQFYNQSSLDVVDYKWEFGDGVSSIDDNPTHIYDSSGIYDVSLIVNNAYGCKDTIIMPGNIRVLGPSGNFELSTHILCKNDSLTIFPDVINTDNYLWNFDDGTITTDSIGIHAYNSSGIFFPSLKIQNNNGCEVILYSNDSLHIREIIIDAGIDQEICQGASVQLNASGNGQYFEWSPTTSINFSNISSPLVTPNEDIVYYVNNYDSICSSIDSISIRVFHDVPQADFISINHCEFDSIYLNAISNINISNILYEWSIGFSQQNIVSQLPLGNNQITLKVTNLNNQCSDSITKNITIYPLPYASFDVESVCFGDSVNFETYISYNVSSIEYDFGDNNISNLLDPTHYYQLPGYYQPSLRVVSDMGCVNNSTIPIQIYELPLADVIIDNTCIGNSVVFQDNSTINNGNIFTYKLNSGDGSIIESYDSIQTYEYQVAGNYDIIYTVQSDQGCESMIMQNIQIYEQPNVDITSSQYCFGDSTLFFTYLQDDDNITDWYWDFGDKIGKSYSPDPYYIFQETGSHIVTLHIKNENNCMNTIREIININPLPEINLSLDSIGCVNEIFTVENIGNNDDHNIITSEWNFGDGNIQNHEEYIYTNPGIYDLTLKLISNKGCINNSLAREIQVFDVPDIDFYCNNYATLLNAEIEFFNQSEDVSILEWDFDNGMFSYQKNPIIHFSDTGKYNVNLTIRDNYGCENSLTKTITIQPEISVFIPNSFSPNNDGINDIFKIETSGINSFNMKIFDRWGKIIFESDNIDYGWNGDITHYSDQSNIYIYIIELYDYNNKRWVYNDEIKLIR